MTEAALMEDVVAMGAEVEEDLVALQEEVAEEEEVAGLVEEVEDLMAAVEAVLEEEVEEGLMVDEEVSVEEVVVELDLLEVKYLLLFIFYEIQVEVEATTSQWKLLTPSLYKELQKRLTSNT